MRWKSKYPFPLLSNNVLKEIPPESQTNSIQQPLQTLAPNFPNLENPYEIPLESQTIEQIPSNQDTPVGDLSVQWLEIADSYMSNSKSFKE
jgi:hypothetical protein